jgi:hypothetical protein
MRKFFNGFAVFSYSITGSKLLLIELIFVNAELELVVGVSFFGLFLELLVFLPVDFLAFCPGFAGIGIWYPLLAVYKHPFEALLEWSTTRLYGICSLDTCIFSDVTSDT